MLLCILWILTNVHTGLVTFTHPCSIVQSGFKALKIFCVLPIHSSLPTNPWQPLSFYALHCFAHSGMSYSWNHMYVAFSDWLLSVGSMH